MREDSFGSEGSARSFWAALAVAACFRPCALAFGPSEYRSLKTLDIAERNFPNRAARRVDKHCATKKTATAPALYGLTVLTETIRNLFDRERCCGRFFHSCHNGQSEYMKTHPQLLKKCTHQVNFPLAELNPTGVHFPNKVIRSMQEAIDTLVRFWDLQTRT